MHTEGRETDPADGPPAWFLGDLDDPWVVSIADALPAGTTRLACAGDLPDAVAGAAGGVVVVHRAVLSRGDAERLARWRSGRGGPAWVVLCFGPHVRHADLERWAGLVDAAVPEATARDTIARQAAGPGQPPPSRRPGARPRVAVVSANAALRQALAESCEAAGYPSATARDWSDAPPAGPALWDVPLLEPDWPQALARRCLAGPVVTLMGFADRAAVAEARARGASACLELPADLSDLVDALDRLPAPRDGPGHEVPPPPASRRRSAAARAVADAAFDA